MSTNTVDVKLGIKHVLETDDDIQAWAETFEGTGKLSVDVCGYHTPGNDETPLVQVFAQLIEPADLPLNVPSIMPDIRQQFLLVCHLIGGTTEDDERKLWELGDLLRTALANDQFLDSTVINSEVVSIEPDPEDENNSKLNVYLSTLRGG